MEGEWLDSSRKAEFDLCPRRYYYRHELGIVPYKAPSENQLGEAVVNWASPMQFGVALHAALVTFYQSTAFNRVTCPCPEMIGCEFCLGDSIPNILAQFLLHYPD